MSNINNFNNFFRYFQPSFNEAPPDQINDQAFQAPAYQPPLPPLMAGGSLLSGLPSYYNNIFAQGLPLANGGTFYPTGPAFPVNALPQPSYYPGGFIPFGGYPQQPVYDPGFNLEQALSYT